jgi:hypothetical protein
MNYIHIGSVFDLEKEMPLFKLVLGGKDNEETAFIGSIESYEDCLFLISYDRIILASNPKECWWRSDLNIKVKYFVDLDISVKNKR